ncbi:MAG: hypothetical protein R2877_06925 [Bdellovibrionota bacterium]
MWWKFRQYFVSKKDQTQITEFWKSIFHRDANVRFDVSKYSIRIDECNSQVAQLVDIKIENNEMHFNFEAIGAGETEVGIECTGSITENHTYSIIVD